MAASILDFENAPKVIDISVLTLACLLLWTPRHLLAALFSAARGRRRRSGPGRINDPWKGGGPDARSLNPRIEILKPLNYLDFARAATGAALLWGGFGPTSMFDGGAPVPILWRVGVVLIGIPLQTLRFGGGRVRLFPPVFFLGGVVLGVAGWKTALFAFVLSWTVNQMLPNAQAFLFVNSCLVYAFGSLFGSPLRPAVIVSALFVFFPFLISLLVGRPLQSQASRETR